MLVRYKTLIFDPETVKCVELVAVKNATSNHQDIRIHFNSHSMRPRLKDATMEDFDAIWSIVSAPRGIEHKTQETQETEPGAQS